MALDRMTPVERVGARVRCEEVKRYINTCCGWPFEDKGKLCDTFGCGDVAEMVVKVETALDALDASDTHAQRQATSIAALEGAIGEMCRRCDFHWDDACPRTCPLYEFRKGA